MVTAEERMKVLQMLQEGKINPESAAQLLQAMEAEGSAPLPPQEPFSLAAASKSSKARWLRVRVTDTDSGRPRVNVRLPISLVNMGVKLGAHFAPEIDGLDLEALLRAADASGTDPFVDVYDDKDGEHVEVFLE